jgi:hypothetical protein
MNQREIDALEKCIEQLKAGVLVEECLNQIPDLTPEMEEIIRATSDLMSFGETQVSGEQIKRSLTRLLSEAERLKVEESESTPVRRSVSLGMRIGELFRGGVLLKPLISRMTLVLGITAVLILLSGGLVITSAKSLPGDSLYPVKRAVEDITVYLVPSREIRLEYEVNYSQQRVDEVNRLIALHRRQQISFEGVLYEKSSSEWTVSGIPVTIQSGTTFVGVMNGTAPFVNGSVVEVEGITNSRGEVTANEIHLRQYIFTGTVEKIDKNIWQISGIKLSVTSHTQIGEGIKVGDVVNVLIRSEDDGLNAISIKSAETPVNMSTVNPTLHDSATEIVNPTEYQDLETYEEITTPEVDHTPDNEEPNHEGLQATAVPPSDGEHEGTTTVAPSENHEIEDHQPQATTTPEQHESPEETESPNNTP